MKERKKRKRVWEKERIRESEREKVPRERRESWEDLRENLQVRNERFDKKWVYILA